IWKLVFYRNLNKLLSDLNGNSVATISFYMSASFENTINEFCFPMLCVAFSIIYMFVSNHIGQNIIDHNNYVFSTAYNVQWYRVPLRIQKMILFLLQRETKVFLNLDGVFDASMESFGMII
ncbi:hypothetical protein ALC53_09669, partial [Atta colombica]